MEKSTANVLILAGFSPIQRFARLVKTKTVGGLKADDLALANEWRAANAYVRELESTDTDAPENHELQQLPQAVSATADKELSDVSLRRSLGLLPCRWALVELDRMALR
jgi:hypothetical protein